jgi:hypothetical protein
MTKEKDLENAVNNISRAIRQYKGTYEEHVQLQNDLKLMIDYINGLLEKNEEKTNENES